MGKKRGNYKIKKYENVCYHRRRIYDCEICKGCIHHNKSKFFCLDCGIKIFSNSRGKYKLKQPERLCFHNKRKYDCKICNQCSHKNNKYSCMKCGSRFFCKTCGVPKKACQGHLPTYKKSKKINYCVITNKFFKNKLENNEIFNDNVPYCYESDIEKLDIDILYDIYGNSDEFSNSSSEKN